MNKDTISGSGPTQAAEIAGEMVDAVMHDSDLLDLGSDAVATRRRSGDAKNVKE